MDAFDSALLGKNVRASARVKLGNTVKTVTLLHVPADTTEEAFAETAERGVALRKVVKDGDRARNYSNPEVLGAAAVSATLSVLGISPPAAQPPAPAPEPARKNGAKVGA